MATSAWGGSWGESPNSAWGDSWGFEGFTPPVAPPADAIPPGGGNYLEWWEREWNRIRDERKKKRKKAPKKKRELLDELDDIILELRSRAEDSPPEVRAEVRQIDYFADMAAIDVEITAAQVRAQIAFAEAIMREIDDEETILLAFH